MTKLEYAFAMYDEDNNGYLDRNEIRVVIRGMINLFGSNVNRAKTNELTEECINILDVNNDGKVSKGTSVLILGKVDRLKTLTG